MSESDSTSIIENRLEVLNDLLQKDVTFSIANKVTRKGILLLYNLKGYHITFIIRTIKGINKTYEIPYPFDIERIENRVILDYTLRTLCINNDNKIELVKKVEAENGSKLYDKRIIITEIEPKDNK